MSKNRGRHTTFTDFGAEVAKFAKGLPGVTGVSAGRIEQIRRIGSRRAKFVIHGGCILATILQSGTKQELRIYAADLESTKKKLESRFSS